MAAGGGVLLAQAAVGWAVLMWLVWLAPDPVARFSSPAMVGWLARFALLGWAWWWAAGQSRARLSGTGAAVVWCAAAVIDVCLVVVASMVATAAPGLCVAVAVLLLAAAQIGVWWAWRGPSGLRRWGGVAAAVVAVAAAIRLLILAWQYLPHGSTLVGSGLVALAEADVVVGLVAWAVVWRRRDRAAIASAGAGR